ncbi:MAG: tetratricopeptide repeat protein [Actinomycetota bacterium]
MNEITVGQALALVESLVYDRTGKHLTELQRLIFCGVWEGKQYKEIVPKNDPCTAGHARGVGSSLWQILSGCLGEKVDFRTLKTAVERYARRQPLTIESATLEPAIAANNCGFDCYITGDLTQANKQFELALKINPNHAASYYNQAWSYEQVGDFNRALELYRQAALNGFAAAYCNLARLHIIEDKKYDLAVDICQRGLALVQAETVETDKIVKAALLTYLAWAWINQGRDEEALEKLQAARELDENRTLTYALMAQALENMGQYTEALEAWKTYVKKYPKCERRDKDILMGKARQRLKEQS